MFSDIFQDETQTSVFDVAPVLMTVYDTELNVIRANRAFMERMALTEDEIRGKKCYEALKVNTVCPGCPVLAAVKTGTEQTAEISPASDGCWADSLFGWQIKAVPLKNKENEIVGSVQVITETSQYRNQLLRYDKSSAALIRLLKSSTGYSSKELLQKFLDESEGLTGSSIGFYHFVEEDQITLSLQTWSTKTIQNCTAPGAGTHYPIAQAGVWVDCVRKRKPIIHNDYLALTHKKGLPTGHVPLNRELVVPVMRDNKIMAILGVGNKETDYDNDDVRVLSQIADLAWEIIVRKRAEEENDRLQKQVAQIQKMESIGRLAGGVAHDYNNMLSLITGYTEMSLDETGPESPVYNYLQEIMAAAERSTEITRQLLAFARRQTISPQVIDLNQAVEKMLKMLHRLIGENINLSWKPNPETWRVKMDPVQIDQLLANLCVNARDAIDNGGKITIETGNRIFGEDYCEDHPGFLPGEYARLVVSDNGCGMNKGTVSQIFEPFYTTKSVGEGTGLGLAMVYGIVKQNGGFINVYSEPGEGTSFHIYLARNAGETETPVLEMATSGLAGQGETILIVEDEISILNLTAKMLNGLGYTVLTAETPDAALQTAKSYDGKIDLLLTDVVMPEMNGRDLATALHGEFPELKTLFMSGYTANVIAHHGVLEEGVNFIQKPISRKDLAIKIQQVLEST